MTFIIYARPGMAGLFFVLAGLRDVINYRHHYRQTCLEALKIGNASMTTNQKVVGSNPAGLTRKETPGDVEK